MLSHTPFLGFVIIRESERFELLEQDFAGAIRFDKARRDIGELKPRASSLSPGSLTALLGFSIGSKRYEPGEMIDCANTPTLAEALVRFGYASRMPAAALTSAVGSSRLASADLAKERLKRALANTAARRSGSRKSSYGY